jgi:O-phosphoseryl-tRNA(Cys) synthetase
LGSLDKSCCRLSILDSRCFLGENQKDKSYSFNLITYLKEGCAVVNKKVSNHSKNLKDGRIAYTPARAT